MYASPLVSIVLGTYNRLELLKKTIDNVRAESCGLNREIIVIDGGSTDGSMEWLTSQTDIVTIIQHNRSRDPGSPIPRRSWGYFMNLGFKITQGKYVLMVSDDCILLPGSLKSGIDQFERLNRKARIGGIAFYFRNWPEEEHYYVQRTLGGKLMVNHGLFLRSALEDVDWVEEDYYMFYKADGDLCLKIWELGYKILEADSSYVEHYMDNTELVRVQNNRTQKEDAERYRSKWKYHTQVTKIKKNMGKVYCEFQDTSHQAEGYFRDYHNQTLRSRVQTEITCDHGNQPRSVCQDNQSMEATRALNQSTEGEQP
ncbi:glycosyltransferase family 2 protein [Cyanobium sp. ATX 6F1]|uniref:glycosyltransferase family 2 protein n=1 Tax=Cyanobium sp. ATX 6F1 TaxID=2823702 RepID=UPI0020CE91CD|nr:glycosyltransferase [Cyanobium sp. ATX 6F1]